jgi:hypothetical protein
MGANAKVEFECFLEMRHHILSSYWAPKPEWFGASQNPSSQPQIGKPDHMVGMKMREEQVFRKPNPELEETLHHTASGIKEKFLSSGFDQRARTEAIHNRTRCSGTQ